MTTVSSPPKSFSRPRGPLASFAFPQFRKVWLMSVAFALGHWGERLAVGWVVLVETESVFLTAATFAVRQAPQIIAAPIGGAISDRFTRGKILFFANLYKLGIFALLAYIAANGLEPLWLAFVLLAFSGIGSSFELPSTQGLVTGSVPRKLRMNAVAVSSTGARAIGALGALASGFAIESLGVPTTLVGAGLILASAGTFALIIDRGSAIQKRVRTGTIFGDITDGLRMMWQIPVVRVILLTAVVVEIFGFAFGSVMPAVARNVLNVDASGLGTLSLMQGIGSVIGTVILTSM